jgi:alpha-mannosidase
MRAAGNTIENEHLRVIMADDGTVTITDKATRRTIRGGNRFEDDSDAGDLYNWSPVPNDKAITAKGVKGHVAARRVGTVAAEVTGELPLRIPAALTDDWAARGRAMIDLPLSTTARLTGGGRRVEFITVVDNLVRDHRLRVAFPTGIAAERVDAGGQFDIVTRPAVQVGHPDDVQPPMQTKHCQDFVSVSQGRKGFTLLNRGLTEYQARPERGGITLLQTLLRGVGWIGRAHLATRPEGAGPAIEAPGGQCLGQHRFDYAVVLHDGSATQANVWQDALDFTTPTFVRHLANEDGGSQPVAASAVTLSDPRLAISDIKPGPRGGITVRVWNPSDKPVAAVLETGFDIAAAKLTDLLEKPVKALPCKPRRVSLPRIGPKQIVTVWLKPARRGPKAPLLHARPDKLTGHRCWE